MEREVNPYSQIDNQGVTTIISQNYLFTLFLLNFNQYLIKTSYYVV